MRQGQRGGSTLRACLRPHLMWCVRFLGPSISLQRRGGEKSWMRCPRVLDTLRLRDWTPDAHYTGPVQTRGAYGAVTPTSEREIGDSRTQ